MRNAMEFTQWHKIIFDIFDAGFDPPFFTWIFDGARVDDERVSVSELRIGSLHRRFVVARLGDGRLEIINPNLPGNAVEPFERVPVAGQPCLDRLVAHELGVLVPAPGEGAHEYPCLEPLTADAVNDDRPRAEIYLRHFAYSKIQLHRRCRRIRNFANQKSIERVYASAI